jgi:hypothetical protein
VPGGPLPDDQPVPPRFDAAAVVREGERLLAFQGASARSVSIS